MRKLSVVDRTLARWALGMLFALLLALGSLTLINRLVYGPTGEVRAYFQALQAGDGSHALGISNATVPHNSGAALLDGYALADAVSTLKDLKLTTEQVNSEQAVVRASYTLGGEPHSTDFHLTKVGSHWGVFDVWDINPAELPTLEITAAEVNGATVNGTKVSIPENKRQFAAFYPGIYTSTYESALLSSQQKSAEVLSANDHPSLALELTPSEAALNSITNSVKQHLDSCATQNTLYPAGCPFSYDFAGRVQGDVTWSIKEYPTTSVTVAKNGTWNYKKSSGVATIAFTQLDLLTGKTSQVTDEVPFTYSTQLNVSDEAVTVTPAN